MQPIEGKNYIGGEWQDTRQTFESLNPADRRETVGTAPLGDAGDVDQAVAAAKGAYDSWRDLSWVRRAEYIDAFAQLIKRDLDDLSRICTRECGKALNEGRADAVEALTWRST